MSLKLEKVDKNGQNLKFWMFLTNLKTLKWSLNEARALKTDKTLHLAGGGGG